MWFIRLCILGIVSVYFVGVYVIEKVNVENIIKGLKYVIEKNLKIKWNDIVLKLVVFFCDGVSVNIG